MNLSQDCLAAHRRHVAAAVVACGIAACLAAPRGAGAANLLVNGSFEEPVIAGVEFWNSIPGWSETSGFTIEMHRSAIGGPADGDQHVELDSHGSSILIQDVPTTPGSSYDIVFSFSARPSVIDNRVEVSWDGALVDTVSADGTGLSDSAWTQHVYTLTASTGTTRLQFADGSVPDSLGSYLDAVCVAEAAIPPGRGCAEPCTADIGTLSPLDACAGDRIRLLPVRVQLDGCAGAPEYRWTNGPVVLRDWDLDPTYFHVVPSLDEVLTVEVRCSSEPACTDADDLEILTLLVQPTEDVGPMLRVAKDGAAILLTWNGAPLPVDGGHYHVTRSDQPDAIFTSLDHSPLLATTNWRDDAAVATLLFYDVRSADACEGESLD